MYGFHGFGMTLVWILLFLVVAAVVYALWTWRMESSSAKDILDRRYAGGEIDTEEYRKRLRELET